MAVLTREDLLELLEMAYTGGSVRKAVERTRVRAYARPLDEEGG